MAVPAITLTPIQNVSADTTGPALRYLIFGGSSTVDPRLLHDFPALPQLFASDAASIGRVHDLTRWAVESGGKRGTLVVSHNGTVIGLLTYAQEELEKKIGWLLARRTAVHVNGPLLACWLADIGRRNGAPRHLLPQVLRTAAKLLVENGTLTGQPWTVVRPDRNDHGWVGRCLHDTNNGFGGFSVEYTGELAEVDGIGGERKLYVANWPVETLRS